jgi:hypothetical protein
MIGAWAIAATALPALKAGLNRHFRTQSSAAASSSGTD